MPFPWISCKTSIAFVILLSQLTAACVSPIDQSGKDWQAESTKDVPGNGPWIGPAVQVLVNHITCQLITDYNENYEIRPIWQKLADYHFVAAISLNLSVSNNEGFNPSLSFMQPLSGGGKLISPIIANPALGATGAAAGTSGAYSRSLAVSGQLGGTQTNSVTYTYQIDMKQIAEAALAMRAKAILTQDDATVLNKGPDEINRLKHPAPGAAAVDAELAKAIVESHEARIAAQEFGTFVQWCGVANEGGFHQFAKGDLLQGDLAIASNIEDGLETLDAVKKFNIYSSGGPTNPADVAIASEPVTDTTIADAVTAAQSDKEASQKVEAGAGNKDHRFMEALRPPVPAAAPNTGKTAGAGPQSGGASAPTSFSSIVTFNVTAGVGGGPNWNLLLFKGPGGGGGGGGASGGGSSGGAGGSSGGGGQLLNYSRSFVDSFSVSFAPTCRTNNEYPISASWPTNSTAGAMDFTLDFQSTVPNNPISKGSLEFVMPSGASAGTGTITAEAADAKTGQLSPASINWTEKQNNGTVQFVGQILSPNTSTPIGTIVLSGRIDYMNHIATFTGYMSDSIFNNLDTQRQTISYWDTIQGCDVVAPATIQNILTNISGLTTSLTLQARLLSAFGAN